MRKFKVIIEVPPNNEGVIEEEFEVEDDATKDEIAAEARDVFLNNCNYGFHEITDEAGELAE